MWTTSKKLQQQDGNEMETHLHNGTGIVRQHNENASQTYLWAELAASNHEILEISEMHSMMTNSGGSIALHQIKLQTRDVDQMKAYDHIYLLLAREIIPTEQSRAENDQRWSAHN